MRETHDTEAIGAARILVVMDSLASDTAFPLTLADQLNAMLAGWLDRHAPDGNLGEADQVAAGIITVAEAHVPDVEAFCAGWGMTIQRSPRTEGRWAVLVVQGRPLPVRGFVEITSMYRG
jgi:hypothetical protein